MEEGTHGQRKSDPTLDTWKMIQFLVMPQTFCLISNKAFPLPGQWSGEALEWLMVRHHNNWFHSLHNTKSGKLNRMKTLSCKCHSYYCNVHDVGTHLSMFIWGPQTHGLLYHKTESMNALWWCSLEEVQPLVQGQSAPIYCKIKPAQSDGYQKRLKYHWCPTENDGAVFFYSSALGVSVHVRAEAYRWQIVGGSAIS